MTRFSKRSVSYHLRKLKEEQLIWKANSGIHTGYEFITKDKLCHQIIMILIDKFLKDEMEMDEFLRLKEEVETLEEGFDEERELL